MSFVGFKHLSCPTQPLSWSTESCVWLVLPHQRLAVTGAEELDGKQDEGVSKKLVVAAAVATELWWLKTEIKVSRGSRAELKKALPSTSTLRVSMATEFVDNHFTATMFFSAFMHCLLTVARLPLYLRSTRCSSDFFP